MRKIKFISLIMSILSSLFIFSVGFSTWYEFNPPKTYGEGDFMGYGVLEIQNTGMDVFQYSGMSFKKVEYDASNNISGFTDVDTGVIRVEYTVPAKTLKSTNGEFTVTADLGYSNLADSSRRLFDEAFSASGNFYTVKYYEGGIDSSSDRYPVNTTINESDKITFELEFPTLNSNIDVNKDYVFTVEYSFTIPSSTDSDTHNFRNTFGKYMKGTESGSGTQFIATATLEPKG